MKKRDLNSRKAIIFLFTALTIASTNPGKISSNEAKQILTNKSLIEHTYVDGYSDADSFVERAIQENDQSKIQLIKLNCTFETLTPITTVEEIYESDRWSQSIIAEYYNANNPNDESNYLYLGLPSSIGLKGDASLALNNDRADFYKVEKVPKYAINGIVSKEKFIDTIGLFSIPEGIKNNNQFAKIELSSEQEGFYTIKVTVTDDRLNKKIFISMPLFSKTK